MDIQIKKYADSRNLKALKFIFVDALDVDPTFVQYEEEYDYCKSIPSLLEPHVELTPFVQDENRWDQTYWTNLKTDLVKNFSDRRMMHMKEVAQVFWAEKIQKILSERSAKSRQSVSEPVTTAPAVPEIKESPVTPRIKKNGGPSHAELETRELEEKRKKCEEEYNCRIEEEQIARWQLLQEKPIYRNQKWVFTMSPDYEFLTLRSACDYSNSIIGKIKRYKRVPTGDLQLFESDITNQVQITDGRSTPFVDGREYDIYALFSRKFHIESNANYKPSDTVFIVGYILVPRRKKHFLFRSIEIYPSSDLYFVYEGEE